MLLTSCPSVGPRSPDTQPVEGCRRNGGRAALGWRLEASEEVHGPLDRRPLYIDLADGCNGRSGVNEPGGSAAVEHQHRVHPAVLE